MALVLLSGCPKQEAKPKTEPVMSESVIDEIRITLTGPDSLPLSVVLRDSPAYDGPRNFFTVSLKNESDRVRKLPFDELQRNTITKYANSSTGAEIIDNETPPPKLDGSVEELKPGETKSFQVVFEYPAEIATMQNNEAVLQFCAKWESGWLRKTAYSEGSYDWNESFEICRKLRVVKE